MEITKFEGNAAGGGSRTNKTGLTFEKFVENNFRSALEAEGYVVEGNKIIKNGNVVATRYPKTRLYSELCKEKGINWREKISSRYLPDDAILVHETNTLYIVEKKYQASSGSNDEKLQTAPFKIRQYTKLFGDVDIKVDYSYALSDWFREENNIKYKDFFEYYSEIGVKYYFNEIPISHFGL